MKKLIDVFVRLGISAQRESVANGVTVMGGSKPKVHHSVYPEESLGYNDLAKLHRSIGDSMYKTKP